MHESFSVGLRRLVRPLALTALALVAPALVSAPSARAEAAKAGALPGEVERWFRARIDEQKKSVTQEPGTQTPLWHERSSSGGETAVPNFVPPTSLAPLVQAVGSGVVNVSTSGAGAAAGAVPVVGGARQSLGSGFIISPQGFVVTNNHVVDRAKQIRVQLLDGREFPARVRGRDATTDLALLQLEGDFGGELPYVYLGDSDGLQVGDWVVAIGNPFGLTHSVSHGMISAKERVLGIGIFDDFIQTDALINPGNSGGPLFNMRGEVVGVNTAVVSQGQGIGFAVPIALVKDLLPNLLVNGGLERGWLGVHILEQPASEGGLGAVVKEVFRGSPAAVAGIRPGDRVVAVNGKPIETYLQLLRRVSILAPGVEVRLSVERGKEVHERAVRLAERPAPESLRALADAPSDARELGLLVRPLTTQMAQAAGLEKNSGVWVAGVIPGGVAERAGLRAGDVITEVNRHKITGVEAYRAAIARSADQVLVRVQRGDVGRYIAIPRS